MQASCVFTVEGFEPTDYVSPIQTGTAVGFAFMDKHFTGDLEGISRTQFTSAYDEATGAGTYLALESVEGTLGGRRGAFNLAHMASTAAGERFHHQLVVVPGSGTGELRGLSGTGELHVDENGTHRLSLDYALDDAFDGALPGALDETLD